MKRFTETEKWNDPWFRRLKPDLKLLWGYICDRCDNSGVWVADWDLVTFHTGVTYDSEAAKNAFNERIYDIGRCRWWLPKFINFQFGDLNPEKSKVHKNVSGLLAGHGLLKSWEEYRKGMHTLLGVSLETPGKGKEKGQGQEEGLGEKPRPRGIPANEREAIAWADLEAVPPDFARDVFHQCEGVDWIDGSQRPITNWRGYIKGRFSRQQKAPPAGANGHLRPYELEKLIKRHEERIAELRNQYAEETDEGSYRWPKERSKEREECAELKRKVEEMKRKIREVTV